MVLHRTARDRVRVRIVWRGGATTTAEVPVTVGALADPTGAAEMERRVLALAADGVADDAIARDLTRHGYRSPLRRAVLPSTVKTIRLRHRVLRQPSQSHPRRVAGHLTVPQLARALDVTPHWLCDRIHNGRIPMSKDPATGLYLVPDNPAAVEQLRALAPPQHTHPGSREGSQDA